VTGVCVLCISLEANDTVRNAKYEKFYVRLCEFIERLVSQSVENLPVPENIQAASHILKTI